MRFGLGGGAVNVNRRNVLPYGMNISSPLCMCDDARMFALCFPCLCDILMRALLCVLPPVLIDLAFDDLDGSAASMYMSCMTFIT